MGNYDKLKIALDAIASKMQGDAGPMNFDKSGTMRKYLGLEPAKDEGTSEGAKKGWETRRAGGGAGVSAEEGEEDDLRHDDLLDYYELHDDDDIPTRNDDEEEPEPKSDYDPEIHCSPEEMSAMWKRINSAPLPMDEKSVRARNDAAERRKAESSKYKSALILKRVACLIDELNKKWNR